MVLWPAINTGIIVLDLAIILRGLYLIKVKRDVAGHMKAMKWALWIFLLFLASFAGKAAFLGFQPVPTWPGFPIQPRTILYIHEAVALVTIGLLAVTYHAAFTKRWARHKRFAPWAGGFWIFESVFGIAEFFILYWPDLF